MSRHYAMGNTDQLEVSISNASMLKELNVEKSRQYMGLTVYVASVAILGILGNAIALVFYMKQKKQNVTNILIIALTINDLLMSFLIFTNIYDFFHTLTFPSNAWCKIYYVIIRVFGVNSLFFLTVIGFDRFVHIYEWPHWLKVLCKLQSTKYVICACVTMSTLSALRDIWLVELTPVYVYVKSVNRTITGAHCMPARRPEVHTIITVFHLLDVSTLVAVSILIIVLHSLIIRKVATVRNQLDDFSKHSRLQAPRVDTIECGLQHTINHSEGTTGRCQPVRATESVHVTPVSHTEGNAVSTSRGIHNVDKQMQPSNKSKKKKHIEKRITIMIFVMTATSLLSYVPYLIISLLTTYDNTSSAWEVLAHRSYIIMSTLNPCIIGFFHSEFRRFIVDRVLCCRRRLGNS